MGGHVGGEVAASKKLPSGSCIPGRGQPLLSNRDETPLMIHRYGVEVSLMHNLETLAIPAGQLQARSYPERPVLGLSEGRNGCAR